MNMKIQNPNTWSEKHLILCALASVSNGSVEVRRTCAPVSTLTDHTQLVRVDGSLDVSTPSGPGPLRTKKPEKVGRNVCGCDI
jgi:hypothetical protein